MDQQELVKGSILCARGPPDHRFFLVEWKGPTRTQWLHQRNFLADCLPMIELYFQVNHHLDRNTNLEVSWEYRCSQCNAFLQSEDALESHIQQQHTFPVRPGTIAHYKASMAVKQRYLSGLPKVSLRDGAQLQNRYKSVCLGMTLTATGDDSEHCAHASAEPKSNPDSTEKPYATTSYRGATRSRPTRARY